MAEPNTPSPNRESRVDSVERRLRGDEADAPGPVCAGGGLCNAPRRPAGRTQENSGEGPSALEEGKPWRQAVLSVLPCRLCRTRWRRIQRKGNRQARLAPRRRPASRWHCKGCCVWWRLGSLTCVRRRHGSRGVGSCIAIFVLLSGHFEPRCKERSIIYR